MNIKARHLRSLEDQKPIHVKEVRVYKERGHVQLEFSPPIPEGAITWRLEGDEIVIRCNRPLIYFGHLVMTKDVEFRRAFRSIIRRRRSKKA